MAAITAVVDDCLARIGQDARINARFITADMPRLRRTLIEQICEAGGGPCKYSGKDMKSTHIGMQISDVEFDALVGDLVASLDHFKVPPGEQKDLIAVLAPMRPDIVEPPAGGVLVSGPGGQAVLARARSLRDAAGFLEKATAALAASNRALADVLFSSAEMLIGPAPLADLAPLFRDGAPPRVTTPLVSVPRDSPPQPALVGSSEQENPETVPAASSAAAPKRGALAGSIVVTGARPLPGMAVVTLEPASGKFRHRPPKQRIVEQRNREFFPKVLAVPVGSTVTFPNFDNVFHNVFSRSDVHPFDLGIYRAGQARDLTFDKEGVIRIGCNLHANMSAYVVVVSAPHYVISDKDGKFTFRSLEPGKYRLRVWSEYVGAPVVQDVEVKAAQNNVTVTLASDVPIGPLADKFGVARGGPPRK